MSLLLQECRQISKSIIYFVFIGVIVLFNVTQIGDSVGSDIREAQHPSEYNSKNPLMKPPANTENYGTREAEIPEQVMPAAIDSLVLEYEDNQYVTYPIGFYKNVILSQEEQTKIASILKEITGLEPASYPAFKEKMAEVDDILGGGSKYAPEKLKSFGQAPITYQEKLAEYNTFIQEDQISGAYARLFCDYMGITVSLFSIFVPVAYLSRDRRARMNELLYSRKCSSTRLIITKYIALIVMMLLPFILLSLIPLTQLLGYGMDQHLTVDVWAYLKYMIAWLLPTLMTTTAVGFVLTTLTDTPIAIAVQFLWSYMDLLMTMNRLNGGGYGAELSIRHNSLFNLQEMKDGIQVLVINRVAYVLLSLVLVSVTILIYELKRRGRLNFHGHFRKIFRHRQGANQTNTSY
ncbi:ABC transporter permease [Paenibacillus sanfengchensis]|uniref:ABC transporter permease n=1 Tax=Paenibacillus sanfengchensis TaxID=3119819 RepID=UPI002FE19863